MVFTNIADGVRLRIDWKRGGNAFGFDHVFAVNDDGSWTTIQMNEAKLPIFKGTSPGFDGDSITFTGTLKAGDRSYSGRETFRLTSDDALQHIWYGQNNDGQWQPTAYQECTKV